LQIEESGRQQIEITNRHNARVALNESEKKEINSSRQSDIERDSILGLLSLDVGQRSEAKIGKVNKEKELALDMVNQTEIGLIEKVASLSSAQDESSEAYKKLLNSKIKEQQNIEISSEIPDGQRKTKAMWEVYLLSQPENKELQGLRDSIKTRTDSVTQATGELEEFQASRSNMEKIITNDANSQKNTLETHSARESFLQGLEVSRGLTQSGSQATMSAAMFPSMGKLSVTSAATTIAGAKFANLQSEYRKMQTGDNGGPGLSPDSPIMLELAGRMNAAGIESQQAQQSYFYDIGVKGFSPAKMAHEKRRAERQSLRGADRFAALKESRDWDMTHGVKSDNADWHIRDQLLGKNTHGGGGSFDRASEIMLLAAQTMLRAAGMRPNSNGRFNRTDAPLPQN
jgi:hypothetical protein